MKKVVMFVSLAFVILIIGGCGGKEKDTSTLNDFISVYEKEGIEIDVNEKPFYDLIKAKDAVIFYMDNLKVVVYEYDSNKDLKDSEFEFNSVNGRFGLESSNEQAKEIFDSVE